MTYLKDIKLCVDCAFYGNPHGQRDRCVHPSVTTISLVTGKEDYPYAFAQRSSGLEQNCGQQAKLFVLNEEAALRRAEHEEAMRDAPF
jgi:hypothetical protein